MKMILDIDPFKSFIASVSTAFLGTLPKYIGAISLTTANVFFQHLAWTIAAIAGIISAINGVTKLIDWFDNRKKKNKQQSEDE